MAEARPGDVPFQEAIDYFRAKVQLPTRTWTDLWEGMHARAFVVAGAVKAELVADFHQAIVKAIEQGTTLDEFREDFDRIVATHGWSYNGGRGWRSAVIYNTNLRMARAAGRWQQIERLKDKRPYLRYVAVKDSRTRPEHAGWHGTVLPVDDPWWQSHYPPNGWSCRCTVQSLSRRDLDRFGYQVADQAPAVLMEDRPVNTPAGPATVAVPQGIDTGFGYNVGHAAWGRGQQLVRQEAHGPWEALGVPGGSRPADPPPLAAVPPVAAEGKRARPGAADDLRSLLRSAIGGDEAIFADPLGERVTVGQAIVDHMLEDPRRQDGREAFFPFLPELIQHPAEIWVGFARNAVSGRVSLRRRYVRLLALKQDKVVAAVCDLDGGVLAGTTFFRGDRRYLATLRSGLRIYAEE